MKYKDQLNKRESILDRRSVREVGLIKKNCLMYLGCDLKVGKWRVGIDMFGIRGGVGFQDFGGGFVMLYFSYCQVLISFFEIYE